MPTPALPHPADPSAVTGFAEALADDLEAFTPPHDGEAPAEPFAILDESQAIWAARKLARFTTRIRERARAAQIERSRIDAWLAEANAADVDAAEYFEGLLMDWHKVQRAHDSKLKSIKLPHATLKSRASSPSIGFEPGDRDPDELLTTEPVEALQLARVKREPNRKEAKALLTSGVIAQGPALKLEDGSDDPHRFSVIDSNGEVLEGWIVKQGEVSYSVDPIL